MAELSYKFPEEDLFSALEVTHPEFDIMENPTWRNQLYQNFDEVRATQLFDKIKLELGITNNKFKRKPKKYLKALFSGHKGSGKTVELLRFANEIETNAEFPYLVITIQLGTEVEIQQFEPEYLLPIIISALVNRLENQNIVFDKSKLNELGKKFLQETTLIEELSKEYGFSSEVNAEVGFNLWHFLGVKGMLKTIFSRKNKAMESIKHKMLANQKELIEDFNVMLEAIRQDIAIYTHTKKDIIFILDDFEKCRRNVYESIFLFDTQLITSIQLHLISSVPINTFYQIKDEYSLTSYSRYYLPMIRITDKSKTIFKEMLAKRVKLSAIVTNEKVIDIFIEASGGCVRQLLEILNTALLNAIGSPINETIALQTIHQKATEKYNTLQSSHQQRLKEGNFNNADEVTMEMLLARTILEYNGDKRERKRNPLLDEFFPNP